MRQPSANDVPSHRAVGRTLSSRLDWSLYAIAWLVFAAGFAAVFWLQQRATVPAAFSASISGGLRVVLPAALLGIGAIRLTERISLAWPPRRSTIVGHLAATIAFPTLWIASVNTINNTVTGAVLGHVPWRFPPVHVVHWHYFTGILIYAALAGLTVGRARMREAERRRLEAEGRLLRGQLDPHFLFNTMHTVFALAQIDAAGGEDAMNRFSRLMRYALLVHRDDREQVTLEEEWAFTDDYLHLEALRSDNRLHWTAEIHETVRECLVPPLLLQPLVENAIKHGRRSVDEACVIHVDARCDDTSLVIRVVDAGPGAAVSAALGAPGVGLQSVRSRLAVLDPRPGSVSIESEIGRGFAVTLRLPVIRQTASERVMAVPEVATASVP